MCDRIVRLAAADFEESLAVKQVAFGMGPCGFTDLLPLLYRPIRADCEYAVKRNGRICAVVGVFPMTWRVGDEELRVAGIGGVSTLPEFRGQGLMSRLMRHCVEVMKQEGFHLSWLGGQRQRYGYFGYESCGLAYTYSVSAVNLQHAFPESSPLSVRALEGNNSADVEFAQGLYDRRLQSVPRNSEDFYLRSLSWRHRLHLVEDGGERVGYLIANPDSHGILELDAVDQDRCLDLVRTWFESKAKPGDSKFNSITVDVSPTNIELVRALDRVCDSVRIGASGNWQVFHWGAVLNALMKAKGRMGPMAAGEVSLAIEGSGTFRLYVDSGGAGCQASQSAANHHCHPMQAMRLLFGPLAPSALAPLAANAVGLESWCPLPLTWLRQDGV